MVGLETTPEGLQPNDPCCQRLPRSWPQGRHWKIGNGLPTRWTPGKMLRPVAARSEKTWKPGFNLRKSKMDQTHRCSAVWVCVMIDWVNKGPQGLYFFDGYIQNQQTRKTLTSHFPPASSRISQILLHPCVCMVWNPCAHFDSQF